MVEQRIKKEETTADAQHRKNHFEVSLTFIALFYSVYCCILQRKLAAWREEKAAKFEALIAELQKEEEKALEAEVANAITSLCSINLTLLQKLMKEKLMREKMEKKLRIQDYKDKKLDAEQSQREEEEKRLRELDIVKKEQDKV